MLQTKDLLSTSRIAKDYGKSAIWLNEYLHEKGIQFKQGSVWLLYQKHAEQRYTKSKTHTYSDKECQRILKNTGVLYFWHNDIKQIAELLHIIQKQTNFKLVSFCIWDKGKGYRAQSWFNREQPLEHGLISANTAYIFSINQKVQEKAET